MQRRGGGREGTGRERREGNGKYGCYVTLKGVATKTRRGSRLQEGSREKTWVTTSKRYRGTMAEKKKEKKDGVDRRRSEINYYRRR